MRLFEVGFLGKTLLPSRIIMAPMTRNQAAGGGVPSDLMAAFYAQRTSAALIITEATQISPQGVAYPNTPGVYTEAQVSAWRKVTGDVHRAGGRIFLQLFHAGRISHPTLQPERVLPVAPWPLRPSGRTVTYEGMKPFVTPRALGREEIQKIVEDYRRAANNAVAAEFDGVEIHAANGYLLDQFLRDGTNLRTGEYGGPPENRVRFLGEVVAAVAGVWGSDRVGVRLSPLSACNSMHDSDPENTFGVAVERLNRFSLAYLHMIEDDDTPLSGPRFSLDRLRLRWKHAYIVNGGYDCQQAEFAIARGRADFVSFGRLFVSNPDLPRRFKHGLPLIQPESRRVHGREQEW